MPKTSPFKQTNKPLYNISIDVDVVHIVLWLKQQIYYIKYKMYALNPRIKCFPEEMQRHT